MISLLLRIVEMLTGATMLAVLIASVARLIRLTAVDGWRHATSRPAPCVPFRNHPPEAWAAP